MSCIVTSVRPRNVVAFKCEGEGGGKWGAGVVTEVVEGGLKVDLLLRKGGIVNEQIFCGSERGRFAVERRLPALRDEENHRGRGYFK